MKTEIFNGKLCEIPETEEEMEEMIWPKKEREAFLIEERIAEIVEELKCFVGYKKITSELKCERAELKKRLRDLNRE